MTEQIKNAIIETLENALKGVSHVPSECPFVGTNIKSIYLETLKDREQIRNESYNQALDDVMKIYNEMQPQLATHVYEFGERIKALKNF